MNGKELLNFANKLEDDHKDKGYKWLYDKLRYEIIKKHQEAINFIPCCTELKVEKQKLNFGDWKYSKGLRYISDHTYKNAKGELFDAEDVNKMYDNYYNL